MATVISQQPSNTWSGARLNRLNQQTASLLRETRAMPGVRTACVFDNQGALLAASSNENLPQNFLTHLGGEISRLLWLLEAKSETPKETELRFDKGDLYIRDLGNAFQVILCLPQVNWSLLRITVNVAAAPFEKDAELQKSLGLAAPPRRQA